MKKLLFILFLTGSVKAQMCVQVNCPRTISYPLDTIKIAGLVTTSDNSTPLSKWKPLVGSATIDNPASINTIARGLSRTGENLFVFTLTATNGTGQTGIGYDTVRYIPNQPPVAITGPSQASTDGTAILSGSTSTDPENLPLQYHWVQLSGPTTATISTPAMSNPIVSGMNNGTYVFTLTVMDSGGLASSASQLVQVAKPVTIVKTVTTIVTYYSDGSSITTVTTVP